MTKTCGNCALQCAEWVNCNHNHRWYEGDCEMWEAKSFLDELRASYDAIIPRGGKHLKQKESKKSKPTYIDGGMRYAK